MFRNKVILWIVVILATTVTQSLYASSPRQLQGTDCGYATIVAISSLFEEWLETHHGVLTFRLTQECTHWTQMFRIQEGVEILLHTTVYFFNMFVQCLESAMPSKKFALDDLKSYVNYPSITTVGYAPRFTSNRKFFANLLRSPEFKTVLGKDEKQLKENMVRKMRYCDSVIMDQELIKAMYDREVDQTKL